MNHQLHYNTKHPVPMGSAQELGALLPAAINQDEVDMKKERRERHSRIVTTPLVLLLVLASLRIFHNHCQQTTNHPTDEKISKYVEASSTLVVEAPTTTSTLTEPTWMETTTSTSTPSTTSESTTTTTTTTTRATSESTTTNNALESSSAVVIMDGSRRFYIPYQVRWGVFYPGIFPYFLHPGPLGCLLGGTGPSIRLSCGGKLDFIPQSNCRLEQATNSTSLPAQLYCQGTLDWTIDSASVTCSGTTEKDLQLNIQLNGHSYRCNNILAEHHTWNGVVYEKGGAVGHQVSIATRSRGTNAEGTWTDIVSDRRTAHCSTGVQCLDSYISCQGPNACQATVPYLVTSSKDPQHTVATAAVASEGDDGEACTNNYTCKSGYCQNDACRQGAAD